MPKAIVWESYQVMANINYPARDYVCVPRADDVTIVFDVYDKDGDEFDTAAISLASFVVQEGQVIGGNMVAGGDIYFIKNIGDGVSKLPSGYQLAVTINASDTVDLFRQNMYYELSATVSGKHKTIGAGLFRMPDTIV